MNFTDLLFEREKEIENLEIKLGKKFRESGDFSEPQGLDSSSFATELGKLSQENSDIISQFINKYITPDQLFVGAILNDNWSLISYLIDNYKLNLEEVYETLRLAYEELKDEKISVLIQKIQKKIE